MLCFLFLHRVACKFLENIVCARNLVTFHLFQCFIYTLPMWFHVWRPIFIFKYHLTDSLVMLHFLCSVYTVLKRFHVFHRSFRSLFLVDFMHWKYSLSIIKSLAIFNKSNYFLPQSLISPFLSFMTGHSNLSLFMILYLSTNENPTCS